MNLAAICCGDATNSDMKRLCFAELRNKNHNCASRGAIVHEICCARRAKDGEGKRGGGGGGERESEGGRGGEAEGEREIRFPNQPSSDPKARSADDLQLKPVFGCSLIGRAAGASADSMDVPQEANRRN